MNGSNIAFKTFEARRVTNFTTAASGPGNGGVFVSGVQIPASGVSADNPETGEFALVTAPVDNGTLVEASYYTQWFDDSELDTFLQVSSRWLQGSATYPQTPDALVDALLKFAASEGYLKMAQRWRTYMSQVYKTEDAPKDSPGYNTNDFLKLSTEMRKQALDSRTEFFKTRQGRSLQPLSGRITGSVRNLP